MTEPRWNQTELDAVTALNAEAVQKGVPSILLTPTVLRVLGEGVSRLRDGDATDNAHADAVSSLLEETGYAYGGHNFRAPEPEAPSMAPAELTEPSLLAWLAEKPGRTVTGSKLADAFDLEEPVVVQFLKNLAREGKLAMAPTANILDPSVFYLPVNES